MAVIPSLIQFNYGEVASPDDVNANFETCRQAINANVQSISTVNTDIVEINETLDTVSEQVMPDLNFTKTDNMFIKSSAANMITLQAGTVIRLEVSEDDIRYLEVKEDTDYNIFNIMDTGAASLTAGKDYYLYAVAKDEVNPETSEVIKTVELKASINSTYPTGYTASNSRKIGGFHTLCVAVTSSNAPALVDTNIWASHPAIGYNAGDIIPNSVWCLSHRPISDPAGMVYVDKIDKWVDIYLQSGTGTSTASAYGARVTDTRTPIQHQWDMELKNKKLATDNDFMMFAEGSNQKTAIYGSAAPNPKNAGGHTDTSGKRMISGYFVEECCGFLWQWLDEIAPVGGSGWNGYGDEATRGHSYGMPYVLGAGGGWSDSSSCGSRSRSASVGRATAGARNGGRGVSLPLRV